MDSHFLLLVSLAPKFWFWILKILLDQTIDWGSIFDAKTFELIIFYKPVYALFCFPNPLQLLKYLLFLDHFIVPLTTLLSKLTTLLSLTTIIVQADHFIVTADHFIVPAVHFFVVLARFYVFMFPWREMILCRNFEHILIWPHGI